MRLRPFRRRRWRVRRGVATPKVRRAPRDTRTGAVAESHPLPRTLLFVVLWAALVALVLPNRGTGPTDLQPGARLPKTLYAETAFSFEDVEATERQRELEREKIPSVFSIDLTRIDSSARQVTRMLSRISELHVRTDPPPDTTAYQALTGEWNETAVVRAEPGDLETIAPLASAPGLRSQMLLILSEQMQSGIADPQTKDIAAGLASRGRILVYHADEDRTQARDPQGMDTAETILPRLRAQISQELATGELPREAAGPLARLLAGAIQANFEFDRQRTEEMRDQRASSVAPVIRSFREGEVLLERGHVLTENDLALLEAHQEQLRLDEGPADLMRKMVRTAALVGLVLAFGFLLLLGASPELRRRNSRILLIALLLVGDALLWRGTAWLAAPGINILPSVAVPFAAPVAAGPMMAAILLGPTVGAHVTIMNALILAVSGGYGLPATVVLFATAGVGVCAVRRVRMRSQLARAGLLVGMTGVFCTVVLALVVAQPQIGSWLRQAGLAMLSGILAAFVVGSLLPAFEFLFKIPTDISLLELSDTNHPLLRRMQEEAPGTYHHSLMVANLAESAAEAIGANPLLARVCALYHDIGKVVKPDYFTENNPDHDDSPHHRLAEGLSRLVIQAHVKEGVDLAMKYRLNRYIIDVIQQHHGTSLVKYFYHQARRKEAEEKEKSARNGNGVPRTNDEVREETYRYPGPRPTFKESGIIALADSIEAISRSLRDPSPAQLEGVVRDVARDRFADGQLSDCELTLRELEMIQERFVATLKTMLHGRIAYPKDEDEDPGQERAAEDADPGGDRESPAPSGG